MIAIIISACMIADPGVCKDYKIPLLSGIDPTRCALHAPPHFGNWANEHPGWRIIKWRCGAASDQDI
ncbi:MAG: hypothetical protein H6876_08750 [Hyphomicrobiaceae bacterium]|nr:hypothetical protein [Hyphomicrobiaceae bacterium]